MRSSLEKTRDIESVKMEDEIVPCFSRTYLNSVA